MNDTVEVWKAKDGWRWRRQAANGRIVAEGGEAYERKKAAYLAAHRQNPGFAVKIIDSEEQA